MNNEPDKKGVILKVLVLEDSARDLVLLHEQLSNAGYHLDLTHVENETDFTNSLRESNFDLILSDYKLPGFDAFGALRISQEICPLTPFICISGTIGEETAVELLKLGAVDYVSKERPERLPMAVKRALEGAKIKADYQKATEALRESEKRFRSLLQDIPSISVQGYRMDGTVIYWNEASEKLYGYSYEEAVGRHLLDLIIPPEMQDAVKEEISNMAKTRKAMPSSELSLLRKDGSRVPVFSSHTILHKDGNSPELFCVDLNLTSIKDAEKLKQIQYNIAKAMIATKNPNELFDSLQDELNRVIDARNFMIAFYNEETGMLRSLAHRDEKDKMQEWPAEKSATGYVITNGKTVLLKKEEVLQLKKEGVINIVGTPSEAWLGVPLKIEGKIIGAVVVQNYDNPEIYDQQSIEMMELVAHLLSMYMGRLRAEEKARESDKLKSAFLKNISHEIRTPLNGILGFGELLTEMDHSPEVKKEMLSAVKQSSNRLLNTITDYMDMARLVSDTMEVHKKIFHLQPIIEESVQEVKPQCEVKNISLQTHIPKQCSDICLFSDRALIRKILIILLDNALKFTNRGKITCGCRIMPEFLELYVEDTGIGIADDKLEMIFDNFVQEDASDTRGHEGSGLGLSIARGLVHLLGGSIAVTSKKGKGSTFAFTVPYNETETLENDNKTERKSSIPPGKPLVLLAEDDESNYLYMEEVIQLAECDYLLAKNGEEAVALSKQHPEITLILMDIKMPVMDGLEATRLIREFRTEVPIIATTAYAQTGDLQRFLSAGCNGYLPKPIGLEKLMPLLNGHLE